MNQTKLIVLCIFVLSLVACASSDQKATVENTNNLEQSIEKSTDVEKSYTEESKSVNIDSSDTNSNRIAVGELNLNPQTKDSAKGEQAKEEVGEKKQEKAKTQRKSPAEISFENDVYDFGRIIQGEKIQHEFIFKNKGQSPLVISKAEATCGCTQPIYPFMPIESGDEGKIFVQFNSTGRLGRQKPKISVFSNGNSKPIDLYLMGEVVPPDFED